MYSGPCRIATEIVVFGQQHYEQSDIIPLFSIARAVGRCAHRKKQSSPQNTLTEVLNLIEKSD
jgi:hypothetical protein